MLSIRVRLAADTNLSGLTKVPEGACKSIETRDNNFGYWKKKNYSSPKYLEFVKQENDQLRQKLMKGRFLQ